MNNEGSGWDFMVFKIFHLVWDGSFMTAVFKAILKDVIFWGFKVQQWVWYDNLKLNSCDLEFKTLQNCS